MTYPRSRSRMCKVAQSGAKWRRKEFIRKWEGRKLLVRSGALTRF